MKQVTQELFDYLHGSTHFYMCDLCEIKLADGQVFGYAEYDLDITLADGRVFDSKGITFKRDRIKLSSTIEVDKMNVTMQVDDADKINGRPIMHIAHNGGFDNAVFSLYRCFMDSPGKVVGIVELFSGDIEVKGGGGLELELEVKSSVQMLNVDYPLRKYYPNCPWQVYGAACGVDLAAFSVTGTVTRVIDSQEFCTSLTFADGYFDQGGIEWHSGPLAGVCASIKRSYLEHGRLVLLISPEATPTAGDTFTLYPGCDHAPQTCRDKFNNFLRNRATPHIPLKETIM